MPVVKGDRDLGKRAKPKPKPKPNIVSQAFRTAAKGVKLAEKLSAASAKHKLRKQMTTAGPPKPRDPTPGPVIENERVKASPQGRRTYLREKREERQIKESVRDLFLTKSRKKQARAVIRLQKLHALERPEPVELAERFKTVYRDTDDNKRFSRRAPYLKSDKTDKLTRYRESGPPSFAEKAIAAALGTVGDQLPGISSRRRTPIETATMGPDFAAPVRKGMLAGGKAGLGFLGAALDRPSAAVESAIAKTLVAAGVGDDKPGSVKWKIKRARDPVSALIKGRRHDKDVTGGDITESLGLGRKVGIVSTIVTDPLMYVGAGGLAKAESIRAAALRARLKARGGTAATALLDPRVARMADEARRTGDSGRLLAALKEVADEHGVSTRMLGRTRVERRAKKAAERKERQGRIALTQDIFEDVHREAGRSAKVGGKGRRVRKDVAPEHLYVPDTAGVKAVEAVAKLAKQRELRPGFRVRLLSPLGKEKASIPVPLPERLGKLPLLPVATKQGRASLQTLRLGPERHEYAQIQNEALREIEEGIARAQREGRLDVIDDLQRLATAVKQEINRAQKATKGEITEQAKNALLQSPDEAFARINARRMQRTVAPVADEFGRTAQMRFFQKVLKILDDNGLDREAIERLQLHRWARADTGATSVVKRAGIKLSPAERKAMQELDLLDQQMARFGKRVGTLGNELEDYGGPRIWNPEGYSVDQIVSNLSQRMGSGAFFARHRAHPAVSDLADPDRLAAELKRLSGRELSDAEAREIADVWHETASNRMSTELLGRRLQREGDVNIDDLPPTFQRAARLGLTGLEDDVPLFREAEGLLGLATGNRPGRTYGFNMMHPDDLSEGQALNSAMRDRERVRYLLKTTKSGTKVYRDMRKYARQLDVEIARLQREIADNVQGDTVNTIFDLLDYRTVLEEQITRLAQLQERTGGTDMAGANREHIINNLLNDLRGVDQKLNDVAKVGEEFELMSMPERFDSWEDLARQMQEIQAQGGRYDSRLSRFLDYGKPSPRVFDEKPIESITDDITSRLPDFRESEFFPILDMRQSYFYRTRSEGVNAAFRARWKGIDAVEGRSVREAEAQYVADDGTIGEVRNLEKWETDPAEDMRRRLDEEGHELGEIQAYESGPLGFASPGEEAQLPTRHDDFDLLRAQLDEADKAERDMLDNELARRDLESNPPRPIVMWYDRSLDRVYNADELVRTPPALVPNADRTIFWDLHTGREYVFPHHGSSAVGESINRAIQPRRRDGGQWEERLWPTDVLRAADIEAKRGGEYDIVFTTGTEAGLRKMMSYARYGVTSLFPAYHTRNMISDLLKSMQADSGVIFHPIVNAKLTALAIGARKDKTINIPGLGKMTTEDFLLFADTWGIRSGHHVAEVARIAQTGEFPEHGVLRQVAGALGPSGAIGKQAVDIGIKREDIARFMTFVQRMRANGGDAADATLYMIRHHFNYNDLTIRERRTIRNLFLFYTWYRKNIPLQLQEIAHRPGFFSAVSHSYEALANAETPLNQDWSQLHPWFPDLSGKFPKRGTIPDYLSDRLSSAPISWNGHAAMFGFGAPWADLSLVKGGEEGLRDFVALLNPAITTGAQLAFRTDLLTGRQFYEAEAGGPASAINDVLQAAGLGELDKDKNGRPVIPWALGVALRNVVPGLGRFFGTFEGIPQTRDTGQLQTLGKRFNALHGINVYVSPKPGSKRETVALEKRVRGRAAERKEYLEKISNLTDKDRERLLEVFDRDTRKWANEQGIPFKYLQQTQQSGFYIRKPRRRGGSGLGQGGSGLQGLGSSRGLGG